MTVYVFMRNGKFIQIDRRLGGYFAVFEFNSIMFATIFDSVKDAQLDFKNIYPNYSKELKLTKVTLTLEEV